MAKTITHTTNNVAIAGKWNTREQAELFAKNMDDLQGYCIQIEAIYLT